MPVTSPPLPSPPSNGSASLLFSPDPSRSRRSSPSLPRRVASRMSPMTPTAARSPAAADLARSPPTTQSRAMSIVEDPMRKRTSLSAPADLTSPSQPPQVQPADIPAVGVAAATPATEPVTPLRSNAIAIPRNFYDCPMNDLVRLVSSMLQELVSINDSLPFSTEQLTRFHSRSTPGISIQDYLVRVVKFCTLEKSILLTIIYFIDLLCTSYPKFNINSLTVHRFMITAAMIGSKGLCDSFCTNSHYARVGGVSKVELNLLEVEFLTRVDYRIVPKFEVLNQYYESMVSRLAGVYVLHDGSVPPAPSVESSSQRVTQEGTPCTEDAGTGQVSVPARPTSASAISTGTPDAPTESQSDSSHGLRSVKSTLKEAAHNLTKLMSEASRTHKERRSSFLKRRRSSDVQAGAEQEPATTASGPALTPIPQSPAVDTMLSQRQPMTPKRPKPTSPKPAP